MMFNAVLRILGHFSFKLLYLNVSSVTWKAQNIPELASRVVNNSPRMQSRPTRQENEVIFQPNTDYHFHQQLHSLNEQNGIKNLVRTAFLTVRKLGALPQETRCYRSR